MVNLQQRYDLSREGPDPVQVAIVQPWHHLIHPPIQVVYSAYGERDTLMIIE